MGRLLAQFLDSPVLLLWYASLTRITIPVQQACTHYHKLFIGRVELVNSIFVQNSAYTLVYSSLDPAQLLYSLSSSEFLGSLFVGAGLRPEIDDPADLLFVELTFTPTFSLLLREVFNRTLELFFLFIRQCLRQH